MWWVGCCFVFRNSICCWHPGFGGRTRFFMSQTNQLEQLGLLFCFTHGMFGVCWRLDTHPCEQCMLIWKRSGNQQQGNKVCRYICAACWAFPSWVGNFCNEHRCVVVWKMLVVGVNLLIIGGDIQFTIANWNGWCAVAGFSRFVWLLHCQWWRTCWRWWWYFDFWKQHGCSATDWFYPLQSLFSFGVWAREFVSGRGFGSLGSDFLSPIQTAQTNKTKSFQNKTVGTICGNDFVLYHTRLSHMLSSRWPVNMVDLFWKSCLGGILATFGSQHWWPALSMTPCWQPVAQTWFSFPFATTENFSQLRWENVFVKTVWYLDVDGGHP